MEPTPNRESDNQMISPYVIYVTGIPSKTTRHEIMNYFGQFGNISSVETFEDSIKTSKFGNKSQPYLRGFCILKTSDLPTFERIINFSRHVFLGRSLACREYMTGEQLRQRNRSLNDRRVILKQVPKDITEGDLIRTLENIGGELEMFYIFHSDSEYSNHRRHYTCSAMFKHAEKMEDLTLIGSFPGPDGKPIVVRKYEHNPDPRVKPSATPLKKPWSKTLPYDTPYIENNQNRSQFIQSKRYSKLTSIDEKLQNQTFDDGVNFERNKLEASKKGSTKCSLSYFHTPPPTSAKYHSFRSMLRSKSKESDSKNHEVRMNILLGQSDSWREDVDI